MVRELTQNDVCHEIGLIDDLAAELRGQALLPDDITVSRLVAKSGRSEATCRRFLAARVKAGELRTEVAIDERGNRVTRYVPVPQK